MALKRKTYPGSIYVPKGTNTIYIKYRGVRTATGLQGTKEGFKLAGLRLEQMYQDGNNISLSSHNMSMSEALEYYLRQHPKYMEFTIKNYRYVFAHIFDKNAILTKASVLKNVMAYVHGTNHSKSTINIYLRPVQALLNYFTELEIIPVINLKKYKQTGIKHETKSFTELEIYRLVKYWSSHDREFALLILFMYNTGARPVDALTITKSRIKKGSIVWQNKKTKDDEERPISINTERLLNKIFALHPTESLLFRWKHRSNTRPGLMLNKSLELLSIEKKGRSFQEFRVSFRMRLLKANVPKEVIQYLLRHSDGDLLSEHYTDTDIKHYINYLTNI